MWCMCAYACACMYVAVCLFLGRARAKRAVSCVLICAYAHTQRTQIQQTYDITSTYAHFYAWGLPSPTQYVKGCLLLAPVLCLTRSPSLFPRFFSLSLFSYFYSLFFLLVNVFLFLCCRFFYSHESVFLTHTQLHLCSLYARTCMCVHVCACV